MVRDNKNSSLSGKVGELYSGSGKIDTFNRRQRKNFRSPSIQQRFSAQQIMQAVIVNNKMGGKDSYEGRLEAATMSDLYLFGQ